MASDLYLRLNIPSENKLNKRIKKKNLYKNVCNFLSSKFVPLLVMEHSNLLFKKVCFKLIFFFGGKYK